MEIKRYEEIKKATEYLTATFAVSSLDMIVAVRCRKGVDRTPVIIGYETKKKAEKVKKLFHRCQIPVITNEKLTTAMYYYLFYQEKKRNVAMPEQLFESVTKLLKKIISKQKNGELPSDHKKRCSWCGENSTLSVYHDFFFDRFYQKTEKNIIHSLLFEMYVEKFGLESTIKEEELMSFVWEYYELEEIINKEDHPGEGFELLSLAKYNMNVLQSIKRMYGEVGLFFETMSGDDEQKIAMIHAMFRGLSKKTAKRFLESLAIIEYKHDEQCFLHKKNH